MLLDALAHTCVPALPALGSTYLRLKTHMGMCHGGFFLILTKAWRTVPCTGTSTMLSGAQQSGWQLAPAGVLQQLLTLDCPFPSNSAQG